MEKQTKDSLKKGNIAQKNYLKEIFFPYESARKVQLSIINDIKNALEAKKNIIIHAPTGLGKTVSALSPSLAFALKNRLNVLFVTSRHTQHEIAIQTLRETKEKHSIKFNVVDIVGKKWMCAQPGVENLYSGEFSDYCKSLREKNLCEFYSNTIKSGKLAPKAKDIRKNIKNLVYSTEKIVEYCSRERLCPYEMSISLAKSADVIIADYFYAFNPSISEAFFSKINKDISDFIIIVDEAHNLPSRIKDLASSKLSTLIMERAIKEAKKYRLNETLAYLVEINRALSFLSEGLFPGEEKITQKAAFTRKISETFDYEEIIEDLKFVAKDIKVKQKKSYINSVANFLEVWEKYDEESFARIVGFNSSNNKPQTTLSIDCLDPAVISKSIFSSCYSSILMSGTMNPLSMYKDILGVENAELKKYRNIFPEKNRLNMIIPITTTKYEHRSQEQYSKIAKVCSEITNTVPGNTIVFFPSYDLLRNVANFFSSISQKTIIYETQNMSKQQKAEILLKFKSFSKNGAVLMAAVSGSFGEGIDLPGDYLKAVIVVGIPLQRPDLRTKKLIEYYDKKFGRGMDYGYIFPAFNKVLQNAGRCIRTETDKGIVAFVDTRYISPFYRRCFPDDMELIITKEYKEKIREFFEKTK